MTARCFRGDINHPGMSRVHQGGLQDAGQQPWRQIVDSDHLGEAFPGNARFKGMNARVIEQYINPGMGSSDFPGNPGHILH
ncbi:hypothetical protein D3C73_1536560 [compost metagenome]